MAIMAYPPSVKPLLALSTKQKAILGGGAVLIAGLFIVRKKILGSIAAAQAAPPLAPVSMVPGMGEDSAFDKVAKTTDTTIRTLTGAIALGMGYFTFKEKKAAASASPAPAVVATKTKSRRKRSRR